MIRRAYDTIVDCSFTRAEVQVAIPYPLSVHGRWYEKEWFGWGATQFVDVASGACTGELPQEVVCIFPIIHIDVKLSLTYES